MKQHISLKKKLLLITLKPGLNLYLTLFAQNLGTLASGIAAKFATGLSARLRIVVSQHRRVGEPIVKGRHCGAAKCRLFHSKCNAGLRHLSRYS